MADLDKKIQKVAPDLVQSVLEAQEKKNLERVDMLIGNAIKQLKMSRFKPDQTTCLSLTYLARTNPRVFRQSTVIKDTLKSLLRRDNGPTNIKGKMNDIVLPVLAANILLACCDSAEVRTMILSKIDQWLGGSNGQRAGDLIQHLLATLCMKCQGDQQTIGTLIEMRQHWLQYLEDNFDLYGAIPVDLCVNIRKLLHSESDCDCLVGHLHFLIKHDIDIDGLGDEMGRFILERPMSLNNMLKEENSGSELNKMILKVFIKLFGHLSKTDSNRSEDQQEEVKMEEDPDIELISAQKSREISATSVIVKQEPKEITSSSDKQESDTKQESKPEVKPPPSVVTKSQPPKLDPLKGEAKKPDTPIKEYMDDDTTELPPAVTYLYIRMPDNPQVIKLNKATLEAILNLISSLEETVDNAEFEELLRSWLITEKSGRKHLSNIFEDFALTKPYNLHERLRQKLIQSKNELLVDLGLRDASANQLIGLLQQFGLPLSTIEKINKRIAFIKDTELLRSKIEDLSYFNHLLDFYHELGSKSSKELQVRLTTSVS